MAGFPPPLSFPFWNEVIPGFFILALIRQISFFFFPFFFFFPAAKNHIFVHRHFFSSAE